MDEIIQEQNISSEQDDMPKKVEKDAARETNSPGGQSAENAGSVKPVPSSSQGNFSRMQMPSPEKGKNQESEAANMNMLMDVALQLTVELGRARMTVSQVLDLQHGSVIELDRIAGEAVDIYVNEHILARGEVVVVDDKFGVRITELVTPRGKNGEK